MQKTTAALCNRARALRAMRASGKIKATFINADVRAIAKDLGSRKPKTVVWSNLVDYFSFERFHAVASSIGSRSCVHQAYSMNWTHSVFGASPLDIMQIEDLSERKKVALRVLRAGHNINREISKRTGMSSSFKDVLPTNPMNIMQRSMQGPKVQEAWLDRFLSAADAVGGATLLTSGFACTLPMSDYGDYTMHFAFTYDAKLDVQVKDFADALGEC